MGRKSLKDELQIKQRYADLSAPFFKVLKEHMESAVKADQQWAVEQLSKAFVKMIPTEITGEGGGALQITFDPVFNKDASTSETTGDSTEQSPV